MANESFQDAMRRMGGMYGSAWQNGVMLGEIVEFSGAVEIGRTEVPLVGRTKQGYKTGRESREGTMRVQKIDTKWELSVYEFFSQSLEERRDKRGTPEAGLRTFSIKLAIDDPDAYGYEAWQLDGVQVWRMPLGFSITDETIEREYPVTWESETPISTFRVLPDNQVEQVHQV